MGEYKVYAHINKINGKRYIGITSKEPKARWNNGKGYKTQEPFFTDILKYGWDNFEHIILFEGLAKEEARTIEVELIIKYRTWIGFEDCNGYNATIYNSGSSPKKVSQYSLDGTFIKEYSSAAAAALENGWGMGSYRHLQCVCVQEAQYKSYHNFLWKYSEDPRDISEWVKRYKIIDNPQKRVIYQYDLNKNFIAKYSSASKGAEMTGGNKPNVCAAARGDRSTANGYIWSYKPLNEEDEFKDFTCYDK